MTHVSILANQKLEKPFFHLFCFFLGGRPSRSVRVIDENRQQVKKVEEGSRTSLWKSNETLRKTRKTIQLDAQNNPKRNKKKNVK